MRVSLNGYGVGIGRMSILEYADLAARHEFEGIDIPSMTSAMETANGLGGGRALKDSLGEKGVVPVIFGLAPEMGLQGVEWRKDEGTFRDALKTLAQAAKLAEELGIRRCYCYLSPAVDADPGQWEQTLARRLGEMARMLDGHGVRMGVEWIGPHHLRAGGANSMGANPFIFTMEKTLAFIHKMGVPTAGLIVDSLHAYTTNIREKEISSLPATRIVHVHLSDVVKGRGQAGARSDERLLPGTGEVDLAGFLRGLRATGYRGYVAAEILAKENIASTPDSAAAKIRASLRDLGL